MWLIAFKEICGNIQGVLYMDKYLWKHFVQDFSKCYVRSFWGCQDETYHSLPALIVETLTSRYKRLEGHVLRSLSSRGSFHEDEAKILLSS